MCQHGDGECKGNLYMACAKKIGGGDVNKYMAFAHCLEAGFDSLADNTAKACAQTAGIEHDALDSCFKGSDGLDALVEQAKNTPEHGGVPYILVDGQPIHPLESASGLLAAVCKAYQGPKPSGC
mmetsp:Transcript_51895/g.93104  ORF Transcript_51895/g.93104 Transcript_51895/m.93104 type:complete len:124 (+) Transcript_51895:476-847(+)